ncbi:MAG: YbaY family lipoprotein [Candidatus Promineifilaceae bacterium]
MSNYHTDEEVRNFDIFKGIVAALLLVALFLSAMLGAGFNGEGETPEAESAAVRDATPATAIPGPGSDSYPSTGESAVAGGEAYPGEAYPAEEAERILQPEMQPSLLAPAPGSNPLPGPQTFSGTGAPGTNVIVLADGTELGSTAVSETGVWEMDVDLPEGAQTVQLQALDSDGNIVATSNDISLAQAEAYPGESAEGQTSEEGAETAEAPVVDQPASPVSSFNPLTGSVALQGASAAGSTIAALINDQIVSRATAGEDGRWQLNLDLQPGTYDLSLGQLDEAGNVTSRSGPVSIEVPAELPQIDLPDYSLPDEALAAIDAAEAGSAAEAAANAARTALDSIQLPQIKLPSGPFEWSGSAAPGDQVALVVDGEVAETAVTGEDGTFTLPGTLAAGLHTLQLALLGDDGLPAITSAEISAAIADMSLPTIQLPARSGEDGTVTVSGTADPGSTVELTADGQKVGETVAGPDGTWAATIAALAETARLRVQALGEEGLPVLQSSPVQLPGSADQAAEVPAEGEAQATTEAGAQPTAEAEAQTPASGETAAVTGSVTYEQAVLLPPETTITVQIQDISRPGSTAAVLGEQVITVGAQFVPIPYEVSYDPAQIDEEAIYSMRARIEDANGDLLFTNDKAIPVITRGYPTSDVEIMTVPVGSVISNAALGQAQVDFNVDADSAVAAAQESGSFSVLLDGLESAGLTQTLSEINGQYTLFAPTDDAFEMLPPGIAAGWQANPQEYADFLSNLVVAGYYEPGELVNGLVLRSLAGEPIGITRTGDMIYVNGVPVIDAAQAGQSVVYALPQVILPPLPAGESPPIIDEGGVPVFIGEILTVVGTAEPGERIVLAVDEARFGDIATIGEDGAWTVQGDIAQGIHSIIAYMIDAQGLVRGISPEVILAAP